ncbi:hypothetical protein DMENIID0001_155630 [Sergentomyia squamirostris]
MRGLKVLPGGSASPQQLSVTWAFLRESDEEQQTSRSGADGHDMLKSPQDTPKDDDASLSKLLSPPLSEKKTSK